VVASKLRIGSRGSRLALAQADIVKSLIATVLPALAIEIVTIRTSGDRLTAGSLAEVGGKGLFIKEIEETLAAGAIDLAVHSMKDMPAVLPPQFRLIAVPRREDPRDALISRFEGALHGLPAGARLGTSSPRRHFEAMRIRPDLHFAPLRGNVDTRLGRLAAGELDAIILALAGLNRLALPIPPGLAVEHLDAGEFVPAGGQGALAIEARAGSMVHGSAEIDAAIAALSDPVAVTETSSERAFLAAIGASCTSPVGVHGSLAGDRLTLRTILFSADGRRELADSISETVSRSDPAKTGRAIGGALARRMLDRGAAELIGNG
jgi:hydroxymethylbilane synthase